MTTNLLHIASICYALTLSPAQVDNIVDAIYLTEGGAKAKVPYGILSIRVKDAKHARQICKNTIINNHKRWQLAGRPGCFICFLADKYCPPQTDPKGNENWKKNVHWFLLQRRKGK